MTPEERDCMDLEYLERLLRGEEEEPDMSSEAVTRRIESMGKLCDLSRIIKVPYISYFRADYMELPGRDN